jgi:hypothetical protein
MTLTLFSSAGPDHTTPGRESLDRYYTPQPVADALVRHLPPLGRVGYTLEGHAGDGAWIRALRTVCRLPVHGLDLDPGAAGLTAADESAVGDFLEHDPALRPHAIVGNPPYRDAEAHVRHAIDLVGDGGVVAFLLRLAFLESLQRRPLWADHPPYKVVVLSRRPSFTGGGTDSAAYGFFVWSEKHRCGRPTSLVWE